MKNTKLNILLASLTKEELVQANMVGYVLVKLGVKRKDMMDKRMIAAIKDFNYKNKKA